MIDRKLLKNDIERWLTVNCRNKKYHLFTKDEKPYHIADIQEKILNGIPIS